MPTYTQTLPKLALATALAAICSVLTAGMQTQRDQQVQQCDNFLARLLPGANYPATQVKYLGCTTISNTETFDRASYQVMAREAIAVEQLLHQKFRMDKMRFVCCGWEVSYNQGGGRYRDRLSNYTIRMASGETLITDRAQWAGSDLKFTVTVERDDRLDIK
jgi:hypothetical protein